MRQLLLFGLAASIVWLAGSRSSCAQEIWIHPGSYIDWPETLKGDPAHVRELLRSPTIEQTAYEEIADVPFVDPLLLTHPGAQRNMIAEPIPAPFPATVPIAVQYGPPPVPYGWEILPEGLLYHSYLAGEKEPRMASQWLSERNRGMVWEAAVGGRWGLIRKGTPGPQGEGFQFDIEGAGLVRIDPEEESDLEAADFRAGWVATWRHGPWRFKSGYYHISSHVGDEYLIKNVGFSRRNYVRDALLFGVMYDINPDLQVYGEVANALNANGGAEPIELQFGAQYSPACAFGLHGAPFAAINGHLRQEYNMGGSVNVEAGWQWRGQYSNRLFRVGAQHYNGPSMQWSFVDRYECLTGMGIWFDY